MLNKDVFAMEKQVFYHI